jgi:hypothetical protein
MTDLQLVILLLGGIAGEMIVAGALTRWRDRLRAELEKKRPPRIKLQPTPDGFIHMPRCCVSVHLRLPGNQLANIAIRAPSRQAVAEVLDVIFPKSFPLAVATEIPDIAPGELKLYGLPGKELELPEDKS